MPRSLLLLLWTLALALPSCTPNFEPSARLLAGPEPHPPVLDRRRSYYLNDPARPRLESEVLNFYDGTTLKHGHEREWSETGVLVAEREFLRGDPTGTWRTWYPSGKPRSEMTFGNDITTWSWWYESGQLSSQGPSRNGVKQGHWTSWHENATKSSEGDYVDGQRNGPWTFWADDGSLVESGEFQSGVHIGRWIKGP